MAYKLLGMITWKGAKWFLRRRYGSTMAPKPVLAGGALVLVAAIGLATYQRATRD